MLGQLMNIASRQADGSLRVAEKQAEAGIEKERIKGENMVAKYDLQQQAKIQVIALKMALTEVRQQAREPEATEFAYPYVHELDPAEYEWK